MGHSGHFIGCVESGEARDLFGSTSIPFEAADGTIVEVRGNTARELAARDSAEAALYAVAKDQRLDPAFSPAVQAEVQRWVASPGLDELEGWEHLPFVTIDGASSMDLDQAVYVEADGEGHVVHYALADAGYYVRRGSALFAEALTRGASYYLPGIMVPMLPRALSEGLVSLNPGVARRALMFSMRLDERGECTETRVERVRIRSHGKLSFEGVQAFYDGGEGFGDAIDASLRALVVVGKHRMALAQTRGVVRYRRQSMEAKLDERGVRFTATVDARLAVEQYNEQVSLLCNMEGARLLAKSAKQDKNVEAIYRAHPPPSDEKLQTLENTLESIARSHGLGDKWRWKRSGERPLFEYLQALPAEGAEGRIASAIHRQAVMANVRSSFQANPASHHGVGAALYARFSSPMREIVGVFLHQELIEALEGEGNQDAELHARVIDAANGAKAKQRAASNEGNRLVLDQIFADCEASGRPIPAVLMGVSRGRAYVRLDDPPIDAKVYLKGTDLRGDTRLCAVMHGEDALARIGDPVQVVVRAKEGKRWQLEFV
ncbi:MAG: RNB domain-containing ribonuclease [Myxococcota bacterium]